VKCSICHNPIDGPGFVLTYVSTQDTYTGVIHMHCFESKIGAGIARRLRNLAFDSGWYQTGLPLLNE
jgi:hypothetical protein